jgi:predicted dehydrogenase
MSSITRREALRTSGLVAAVGAIQAAGGVFTEGAKAAEGSPANRIRVGVMGVNGRGSYLAMTFSRQPDCEVAFVCDVDSRASTKCVAAINKEFSKTPETIVDVRKGLEDKTVDVLVVAAPNHWHAPATILGCVHGKHVYVEKPCSHNPAEGEMAVAAARKYQRVVQMGNQRRSWTGVIEAIGKLRDGIIGDLHFARTWYASKRGPIGKGNAVPVPEYLDYGLWQGPAPERPYVDNLVHYNWHWRWHWGNGELGNNGVHSLDVGRWALGVDYPTSVTSLGGRYRFDDDQETPDTHQVSFTFDGGKLLSWEGLSWSALGYEKTGSGVTVHGDKGSMAILDSGWTAYDPDNKEIAKGEVKYDDFGHHANFLSCIREGGDKRPNSDIEDGHKSTLLCHLGNIAYRTGSVLKTDPSNGHIVDNSAATAMWSREYRKGWEPKLS